VNTVVPHFCASLAMYLVSVADTEIMK